ncbi:cell division septal protein [Desulfitobacterium dichloroeliminans LMG P-21439]|uniref:Cell division septal protein n=1 Tax=Desulfitobacterium dichloroeliminans (strain LMG P-21439 / DCA1) TaxID=871963 RepID=L0F8Q9_DESDL|nr:FtsQ-type POTRA domain-containing protein [Desulfitobacterium dichloroeliminans]AGA70214.1 cell division septal protein [Desulfitobacterium dichloroeliminans LMG P-21439]
MEPRKSTTSFLYISLLVILFVVGLSFFFQSSHFTTQTVKIEGLKQITPNEIERLTTDVTGQNLFMLDLKQLSQKVQLHPLVEFVEFKRKFPNQLIVQITERTPVALVAVPRGVVEVDHKGIYLRRLEGWPEQSYPVINGLTIPDTAGPGLELDLPGLKAALIVVGQAPEELKPWIGEVYVNTIEQITLYLTDGVEVRLGKANVWEDKLKSLYVLINDDGYKSFKNGVRYIDFTAAKPVIGR